MSITLNYQLSVFGNYTISPTPDTISTLMGKINDTTQKTFLPNIINSQQIELPSNKITTLSNLGFVSQDQKFSIAILNERIDINYSRIDDSDIDIRSFYEFAVKALVVIIEHSGIVSNRLAINIHQVNEVESFEKLKVLGKSLIKTPTYYNDKNYEEWSLRTNSNFGVTITDNQEILNIITELSSTQNTSSQKAGVLCHVDINTLQYNQNLRFGVTELNPFVESALNIASNILNDIERLIGNE